MEKEIKIDLVLKEQTDKKSNYIRISCGDICILSDRLETAIKAFDEILHQE